MDSFIDALLSQKTDKIPDEYDWFAPLLGDWDCDYYDELNGQKGKRSTFEKKLCASTYYAKKNRFCSLRMMKMACGSLCADVSMHFRRTHA
jgi:hypothetical protein